MKTLSFEVSEENYKKLEKINLEDAFLQFIDDYLENEEDARLKKEVERSADIKNLTDLISENL